MNFKLISYFIDIAQKKSFSEASLRNHISLPAMSQAIKRLEQDLGFPLFQHGKNKFALSPEGEIFLPQADQILKSWKEIKKINSKSPKSTENQEIISLAAPSSLYSSIFIEELSRLCVAQEFQLRLFTGNSREIRHLLESRTCDFAICLDDPFLKNFTSQSLYKGYFGLFQSLNYSKGEALIVGDFGLEVKNLMAFYQMKFKRPLPIVAEVASWDLIAQLVELKTGQGLLPDFHKITRSKNVIQVLKKYPQTSYEIKIYAHSNSSNRLFNFLADKFKNRLVK
ncbi:MAG: LysR family transcriptional regulator [Deltaproteobacteria bacterium]|jgi:DNA-binding transcriptional LysR family regulator|nr:LysR family transcriptional regulator [Deltaproteobacteria bacterium]